MLLPSVLALCSVNSSTKVENIYKRSLRYLFSDYENSYEELLNRYGKPNMSTQRLRVLCIEIYKTLNDLNPSFMKDIFIQNNDCRHRRENQVNNIAHNRPNQVKFGERSLKTLGPKIWNCLPSNLKNAENLATFKSLIKSWNGNACTCYLCS